MEELKKMNFSNDKINSNVYIIKFYDGIALVHKCQIYADTPKEAIEEALNEVKGLAFFNKIRIIKLD